MYKFWQDLNGDTFTKFRIHPTLIFGHLEDLQSFRVKETLSVDDSVIQCDITCSVDLRQGRWPFISSAPLYHSLKQIQKVNSTNTKSGLTNIQIKRKK